MGKVLGIIPARGGSKGIPGKHTRKLVGQSILAYAAQSARESGVIDRSVLSSNDEEIMAEARANEIEVPFERPAELAQDDTAMLPVLQHAVEVLEEDGWMAEVILLLQPTAPLRTAEHIRQALSQLRESRADSVVSVVEIPHLFSPQKALREGSKGLEFWLQDGKAITRRQQLEASYAREGTIYAFWRDTLMDKGSIYGDHCLPLKLSPDKSLTLDTEADWQRAEDILSKAQAKARSAK